MKALNNRSVYGTMPQSVQSVVANALQSEVNEMVFRKKRALVTLLAAILVIALACTALAITLGRTQYDAVKAARKAVMDKYGLTVETMILLQEEWREEDGVWTVVFRPLKYNPEAIGIYTVTVAEGKEPVAAWTHDGADITDESLDAEVWGPRQLEQVVAVEKAQYAQRGESSVSDDLYDRLERVAKQDQLLLDAGLDAFGVNRVPGPDDIPVEDAIAAAKKAVHQTYGVSEERLAQLEIFVMFLKYQDKDEPVYRIHFGTNRDEGEVFSVWLYSPSGKVDYCEWGVEPKSRTLPDGPLKGYEKAVKKFIEEGAFAVRTPAEKAEIAARIVKAGYGQYLDDLAYIAPGDQDLAESDALAAAAKALENAHGFTDETLALFEASVSLLLEDGERVWRVDYNPPAGQGVLLWHTYGREKAGAYSVTLSAKDGAVKQTLWSLEAERGNPAYTESTWGQAPAYDAQILSWLLKLYEARNAIAAQYGIDPYVYDRMEWPLEAAAAHDQLYRDAGFDPDLYPCGVPGKDDVSLEQALAAAKRALKEEFQFTDERLEESTYEHYFRVNDPAKPVWLVRVYRIVDGYVDMHMVWVDAGTGEVTNTEYMPVGNG